MNNKFGKQKYMKYNAKLQLVKFKDFIDSTLHYAKPKERKGKEKAKKRSRPMNKIEVYKNIMYQND